MDINVRPIIALARGCRGDQDLDTLLQRMVDTTALVVWARRSSVRLLDESATRLVAVRRSGTSLHANPDTEFKVGEGLVGWVARNLKPLRTDDAQNDPRFVGRDGMKGPMGSFLGVPLLTPDGSCLGVLSSVEDTKEHFQREHEDLQVLIASICEPHIVVARQRWLAKQ